MEQREPTFGEGLSSQPADATRSISDAGPAQQANAAAEQADRPIPGRMFGPYRIERLLGSGGMGEVYEAEHMEDGHRVALKVLSPQFFLSQEHHERFLREGRLAAAISHPRSLYVYGTEEIAGLPLISMELAPGGTLRERVDSEGPMPPTEAVSAILQVIDGLEAAHAAGIIHRDVKPSNCFLDWDGGIKIGDFGLAIPTASDREEQITTTGTFIGTPAYASPEQIRGSKLDHRSDIYSLGGTLYYLLTGRIPFEGKSGLTLMAAILEDLPTEPHIIRPEISKKLAAVVMRCLAKRPDERFASYKELREALAPFIPAEQRSASLLARAGAGSLDFFLLMTVAMMPAVVRHHVLKPQPFEVLIGFTLVIIASAVIDGLKGISIGRWIAGVRLAAGTGRPPGIPRALGRCAIFWVGPFVGALIVALFGESHSRFTKLLDSYGEWTPLLLFVTARRGNGWSGVHDLFTACRTLKPVRDLQRASSVASGASLDPELEAEGLGPYLLLGGSVSGDVRRAFDPRVRRRIWIHRKAAGAPSIPEARRRLNRTTRPRWLHGRRVEDEAWDAYEAIEGTSYLDEVVRSVPWRRVRGWLIDLAQELAAASTEQTGAPCLRLDHIWIAKDDHAVLLDFPSDGIREGSRHDRASSSEDAPAAAAFLRNVAVTALSGCGNPAESRKEHPWRVLPLHASELLRRLEQEPRVPIEEIRGLLRQAGSGSDSIPRSWRFVQYGIFVIGVAICIGFAQLGATATNENDVITYAVRYRSLEKDAKNGVPEAVAERRSLGVYVAGKLRGAGSDSSVTQRLQRISAVKDLLAANPSPSNSEMARAEEQLRPFLEKTRREKAESKTPIHMAKRFLEGFVASSTFIMIVKILLALVLPARLAWGPRACVVVTSDGRPAARLRAFFRMLVAGAPVLLAAVPTIGHVSKKIPYAVTPIMILVLLVGIAWSIASPSRGLHDRIAGTWLVPK